VHFEIGSITAVASPLVLVPMLFLLPLPLVPMLAPLGYLISTLPDYIRRKKHHDRWIYSSQTPGSRSAPWWLLGLLDSGPPHVGAGGVYVLAFLAGAFTDEVPHAIRERLARGVSLRENLMATLCGSTGWTRCCGRSA